MVIAWLQICFWFLIGPSSQPYLTPTVFCVTSMNPVVSVLTEHYTWQLDYILGLPETNQGSYTGIIPPDSEV